VTTANTNPEQPGPKPPSLVPGVILLVLAGGLIVITLIKPDLPRWLTVSIAVAAVVVVIALLIYAFRVFRDVTRPGGSR
jgi:membrane protein implicated in regulation of membrane protease activity